MFLSICEVSFTSQGNGRLAATATKVQAAIGIVRNGTVVSSDLTHGGKELAVREQFPCVYGAFQHFVQNFAHYASREPCLARSLAYAEVIMLLRCAQSAKALVCGHEQIPSLLSCRRRCPLPRFNYTLRSEEFAWRERDLARYLARRVDTDSFDGFMCALVGLRHAMLAGDFDSFLICKEAACNFIVRHYRQPPGPTAPRDHQELYRSFDIALDKVSNLSHDVLISNCMHSALKPVWSPDERRVYLNDALRLCGSDAMIQQCAATRCHWLEIKSYLDPSFDPVPGFAEIRATDRSVQLPYGALNRINCHRRGESRRLPTSEAMVSVIEELRAKSPRVISSEWLHCQNPFVHSYRLLDFELPEGFRSLFSAVRHQVECFAPTASENWWRQFLSDNACHPQTDASKVALLLAYELRARELSVGDLYDTMQRKRISNPQAALLLMDLEKGNFTPPEGTT